MGLGHATGNTSADAHNGNEELADSELVDIATPSRSIDHGVGVGHNPRRIMAVMPHVELAPMT